MRIRTICHQRILRKPIAIYDFPGDRPDPLSFHMGSYQSHMGVNTIERMQLV